MEDHLATQMRIQRSIERAVENFKKIGKAKTTPATIRSRLAALQELWVNYQANHNRLIATTLAAERLSLEYLSTDQFDATEEVFLLSMDFMKNKLEELEAPVSPLQSMLNSTVRHELVSRDITALPTIELPPFDGNPNDWEQFRNRFTSLIRDNKDISDFSRMHYLSSCVKGRARECIANISVTADNFPIAWKTLTDRYENKRHLLSTHLSSILNLPTVSRESAADLQALFDKLNIAVASMRSLDRRPEHLWDELLVHLCENRVDPGTRKAWNLKTSDSETPPSYEELSAFISLRIHALERLPSSASPKLGKPGTTPKVHVANASAREPLQCLKHTYV